MKFLILALCVCAASAASFGAFGPGASNAYKQSQKTVAAPVAAAAKAVAAPFAAAAAATYQAGSSTYQAAKQVVNQASGSDESQATVLRSESEVQPDGFQYAYETSNGISAQSVGTYKQVGEAGGVVSQGSYRYNSPDGTPVVFSYIADENGYQPQSDLLPVGPEIPEAIVRSIAYNAAHSKDTVQY